MNYLTLSGKVFTRQMTAYASPTLTLFTKR
jgi:hypothetical protein